MDQGSMARCACHLIGCCSAYNVFADHRNCHPSADQRSCHVHGGTKSLHYSSEIACIRSAAITFTNAKRSPESANSPSNFELLNNSYFYSMHKWHFVWEQTSSDGLLRPTYVYVTKKTLHHTLRKYPLVTARCRA